MDLRARRITLIFIEYTQTILKVTICNIVLEVGWENPNSSWPQGEQGGQSVRLTVQLWAAAVQQGAPSLQSWSPGSP